MKRQVVHQAVNNYNFHQRVVRRANEDIPGCY